MAAFEIRNDLTVPPTIRRDNVAKEFLETVAKLEVGQGLVYGLNQKLKDPFAPYKRAVHALGLGHKYRWWDHGHGYGALKRTK